MAWRLEIPIIILSIGERATQQFFYYAQIMPRNTVEVQAMIISPTISTSKEEVDIDEAQIG